MKEYEEELRIKKEKEERPWLIGLILYVVLGWGLLFLMSKF
jgi:hypothetical protein